METFQTFFDNNTANFNKMIANFGEAMKTEKKALAEVRDELKMEHSEMITDVTSKIEKLKTDLAMEANLMDALAEKTSRLSNKTLLLRVLQEKLETLTSEKALFTTSVSEVISYISKVLETNDSVLTPSVRHHLSDKLTPAIQLLKQILSVLGIGSISKKGEKRKGRKMMKMMMVLMLERRKKKERRKSLIRRILRVLMQGRNQRISLSKRIRRHLHLVVLQVL